MSTTDVTAEIRYFLGTRRARITPAQAGLRAYGGNRRVKGLRPPVVGRLDLDFESMELPSAPRLQLNVDTAATG